MLALLGVVQVADAQPGRRHRMSSEFTTDTAMVHDPVMAYEDGVYYLFSTGRGIQRMTSTDRRSWTFKPGGVMAEVPSWTQAAVPGFRDHVWAPDLLRWHGRWWMMYSCSTFGKNTSAIGLISSPSLANPSWKDEGCVVASNSPKDAWRGEKDDWNAIDPNIVIDRSDQPWLTFGSFWDGIQMVRLDSTMHMAEGFRPFTIARRYGHPMPQLENPTSKFAGPNAIEAPFIYQRDGWYYLFVSWDYCCRGSKSTYRVVCGRSRNIVGPYVDRDGKRMVDGGGTLVIEGDKTQFEAAGHCAVYDLPSSGAEHKAVFICHGYSVPLGGQSILLQRELEWENGWPKQLTFDN